MDADKSSRMHNEFTAIVERDNDWFIAYCPEIPGANGQGKTKAEAIKSLSEAIDLILAEAPPPQRMLPQT
jgi:predicted RNase H-like HicB family nuclease